MKIVIIGAGGATGQQLVKQGLAAGYDVTAVVRNVATLQVEHGRLHIAQGDVLQTNLVEIVTGKDAVISSLGVHTRTPTVVYSQGVANIVAAMMQTTVRRFLCISASGLDPGPWWQRWFAKPILWRLFKDGYADMLLMEAEVKRSNLEWTIVRPPRLTNEERTGQYKTAINKPLSRGWKLSRADLANYILTHLESRETYQTTVEIAH